MQPPGTPELLKGHVPPPSKWHAPFRPTTPAPLGQLGRHLPRGILLPRRRSPWDLVGRGVVLSGELPGQHVSIAILLAVFICAFYTSFERDPQPPICVAQKPKYAPVP